MSHRNTRCDNSGKWASPRASKEVQISGSMDYGRSECEIKNQIEMARSTFIKMRDALTSRKLYLEIRKRLVRCYVLSTLLYASESWTLNKQMDDKIIAIEIWILTRVQDIASGQKD